MTINLITRKDNKLQLNGDKLTGDTYAVLGYIKQYCGAHGWDKVTKSWTVDADKLMALATGSNSIGLRVDDSAAVIAPVVGRNTQWRNADGSLGEDY